MKDKKKRIDIYETIWGIDVVVANRYTTLEDLKKNYEYSDHLELDDFITSNCACTVTAYDKKNKAFCVLIKHNHKISRADISSFFDTINSAIHESIHAVLDIYEQSNVKIQYDNQEPVAYEIADLSIKVLKTFLNK